MDDLIETKTRGLKKFSSCDGCLEAIEENGCMRILIEVSNDGIFESQDRYKMLMHQNGLSFRQEC